MLIFAVSRVGEDVLASGKGLRQSCWHVSLIVGTLENAWHVSYPHSQAHTHKLSHCGQHAILQILILVAEGSFSKYFGIAQEKS